MCVICIAQKNRPSPGDVDKMWQANAYGAGASWIVENKVHWEKGVSLPEMVRLSQELPLPYILHFRIPTAGGNSDEMNHPFELGGGCAVKGSSHRGVLFHNGHWSEWGLVRAITQVASRGKMPKGPWSDSRLMAYISQWGTEWLEELSRGQRIAVMTPTQIERFGTWTEASKDAGLFYSNESWRSSFRGHYRGNGPQERAWEEDWERSAQGIWTRKAYVPRPTLPAAGTGTGTGGSGVVTPGAAQAGAEAAKAQTGTLEGVIMERTLSDGSEVHWIRSSVTSEHGMRKWNRFIKMKDGSLVEANLVQAPAGLIMKAEMNPVSDRWAARFNELDKEKDSAILDYNTRACATFPNSTMGFQMPAVAPLPALPPKTEPVSNAPMWATDARNWPHEGWSEDDEDELGGILGRARDYFNERRGIVAGAVAALNGHKRED